MKQMITAITLAVAAVGALAADAAAPAASKPLTAQQQKMSDCAKANTGKKGDDYKAGVKSCLSGTPAAPMTQQQKMSACSKANAGKKGDDFKAGVKSCLAA